MLRTDYIMRMVEQIQKLMAQIALTRESGDHLATARLLDEASTEHLGLAFTVVALQPLAQLKLLFTTEDELDPGKCIAAGELLVQAAALHLDLEHRAQADAMRLRSLELFMAGYRVLPQRERALYALKILDLLAKLPDHALTDHQLLSLVGVYEAAGRYDRAEDVLFPLVEDGVDGALALGLRLYDQLLGKRDEDLEQGGLPRDEVQQSLQELRRLEKGP
ncbi:MAG: DUF6483 family protein [Pseudomonadota bacterium]